MGRYRTIKPEIHGDGTSGRLSDSAFRLLIGLLNFADDVGVNLLDTGEIHARVFPYKKSEARTERGLEELRTSGMTQHFTLGNGKSYVYIVNFLKHQKIDRPSEPMIKGWEKGWTLDEFLDNIGQPGLFDEGSPSPRRGLDARGEGNGKEGKKKGSSSPGVELTDQEHEALVDYMGGGPGGVAILELLIEELTDYMASSGKKYKSYTATLRAWFRRGVKKGDYVMPVAPVPGEPKPPEGERFPELDEDVKKQIKNLTGKLSMEPEEDESDE